MAAGNEKPLDVLQIDMKKATGQSGEAGFKSEVLAEFYRQMANEPGPKRAKLYRAMLKMIEQGFWNPGDRLPTDLELTRHLPLSLATVQAGLNALAEQGLVSRTKRKGTFVASEDHLTRDYVFFQFLHADSGKQMLVDTVELEVSETSETGPWSELLGRREKYLQLSRIVRIGDEFSTLSDFYFADPKIWILLDFPPDSLKNIGIQQMIHLRFGLPSINRDWSVSFAQFDAATAAALGVEPGTTGQRFDVRVRTIGDAPLAFHRILVPPHRHTLHIA